MRSRDGLVLLDGVLLLFLLHESVLLLRLSHNLLNKFELLRSQAVVSVPARTALRC